MKTFFHCIVYARLNQSESDVFGVPLESAFLGYFEKGITRIFFI